jgi:hypothetical protein
MEMAHWRHNLWGTFRLELDAGGVWEESWTVDKTKVDNANVWVVHYKGPRNGRQRGRNATTIHGGHYPAHAFSRLLYRIDRPEILAPPPSQ